MQTFNAVLEYLKEMNFRLDLDATVDGFKKKAYRVAYESLKEAGTLDDVANVKGVGKSILADIKEIETTGKCSKLTDMRKSGPPASIMQLLRIRGIGPKIAMKLFKEGIKDLSDLEKAIHEHRISDPKLISSYYASITSHERTRRDYVANAVAPVIDWLQRVNPSVILSAMCMGSFRRHRPDVRDVDVLVTVSSLDKVEAIVGALSKHLKCKPRLSGNRKAYIDLMVDGENRQLDLNFCLANEQGCATLHFTGSADFNVACRDQAIRLGYKLNQYSLQDSSNGKHKYFDNEAAVLKFLEIPWVPPECRDHFIPTKNAVFPNVIDMLEYVGDFHLHTKNSDGSNTIGQLAKFASEYGYKCIGVSDHSQGSGNGMKQQEALERAAKIKAKRKLGGVTMFAGVELDVKVNGQLDYDVSCLNQFDYVILALHAQPEQSVEMRLMMAVNEIRKLHGNLPLAWAHPTGRLIGSRAEAEVDWVKLFKFCAINKVAIEINGQPARLDLPDPKIILAKRYGCKFLVNSDSHAKIMDTHHTAMMLARRALLTRESVINASIANVKTWMSGKY